ncbi:MAG: diguanylate cyclase [Candidatus Cloacimonetes bacterium]|nr:diguanylate cyclase [Candidatus Cloacimonadota bacterium]
MLKLYNDISRKRFYNFLVIPVLVIIILTTIIIQIINQNLHNHKKQYKQELIKELEEKHNAVLNSYSENAEMLFKLYVDKPEILKLMGKANTSNQNIKNKARQNLLDKLMPVYQELRKYYVRQFHFHLPNYESFLRLHKPDKYGDNLKGIRYSVVKANLEKRAVSGFEEGRVYNGFRNVFPVFYKNEHLGTVEISFDFVALKQRLQNIFPGNYKFFIKKNVVNKKVWTSSQDFYKKSEFANYLYEKHSATDSTNLIINTKIRENINKKIQSGNSFVETYKIDENYIAAIFFPIHNLKEEHVAYIAYYKNDETFQSLENQYFWEFIIVIISAFILILITIQLIRYYLQEKVVKDKLKQNEEKYRYIFENLQGLYYRTDLKGKIELISPSVKQIAGYEPDELIGKSVLTLYEKELDMIKFRRHLMEKTQVWNYELRLIKKNGALAYVSVNAHLVYDQKGNPTHVEGIIHDITESKKARERFKHEAMHDHLTGILNRRAIIEELEKEIARAKRLEQNVAVGLFDIDHFKKVNDKYGHDIGDEVLIKLVKMVKNNLRPYDHLGRYGGEEFVAILPGCTSQKAKEIFERNRSFVAKNNIKTSKVNISITISIGITSLQADASEMIRLADTAMYKAKEQGRNKIVYLFPK